MDSQKPYLSIEEVAKRFGINVTTIYRMARRGELPGFKIGRQWRFSEKLLESWAADQVTLKWFLSEPRNVRIKR